MRLVIGIILLSTICLNGQNIDVGIQLGGAFYLGDLSSPRMIDNVKELNGAVGLLARYQITPAVFVRGGMIKTKVEASDRHSIQSSQRQRNLSFESEIFEVNALMEIHPLEWSRSDNRGGPSPYFFGGVSYFSFNPMTRYNGQLVELQPLGTEGQGMTQMPDRQPYELNAWAMTFGLGLRFSLGQFVIDLEYGARRTNTDYLDDVSKTYIDYDLLFEENGALAANLGNPMKKSEGKARGNDKVTDWYSVSTITVAYRFVQNGLSQSKKRMKGSKCPSF